LDTCIVIILVSCKNVSVAMVERDVEDVKYVDGKV